MQHISMLLGIWTLKHTDSCGTFSPSVTVYSYRHIDGSSTPQVTVHSHRMCRFIYNVSIITVISENPRNDHTFSETYFSIVVSFTNSAFSSPSLA